MDYIIDGAILTDIADVFRSQSGSTKLITPEDMPGEAVASYSRGAEAGREATTEEILGGEW